MGKKRDYEPGLGCPHCKWAGYTPADRTKHISKKHAGEYAGATPDLLMAITAMKRGGNSAGGKAGQLTPFEERQRRNLSAGQFGGT